MMERRFGEQQRKPKVFLIKGLKDHLQETPNIFFSGGHSYFQKLVGSFQSELNFPYLKASIYSGNEVMAEASPIKSNKQNQKQTRSNLK